MCVGRAMRQRPCSHTAPRLLVRTLTPTQGMRQSRPSPSASENLLGKSPASVNAPSLAEEVSFVLTHQKEYLFLFQSLNRKYLTISIYPEHRFLQRKRKYICHNKQTLLSFIWFIVLFCIASQLAMLCYSDLKVVIVLQNSSYLLHLFCIGIQHGVMACVRELNQLTVSDRRCATFDKPNPQSIRCNLKPCVAE